MRFCAYITNIVFARNAHNLRMSIPASCSSSFILCAFCRTSRVSFALCRPSNKLPHFLAIFDSERQRQPTTTTSTNDLQPTARRWRRRTRDVGWLCGAWRRFDDDGPSDFFAIAIDSVYIYIALAMLNSILGVKKPTRENRKEAPRKAKPQGINIYIW